MVIVHNPYWTDYDYIIDILFRNGVFINLFDWFIYIIFKFQSSVLIGRHLSIQIWRKKNVALNTLRNRYFCYSFLNVLCSHFNGELTMNASRTNDNALWANGERMQNVIWWSLMNGEQWVNAKRKKSANASTK